MRFVLIAKPRGRSEAPVIGGVKFIVTDTPVTRDLIGAFWEVL